MMMVHLGVHQRLLCTQPLVYAAAAVAAAVGGLHVLLITKLNLTSIEFGPMLKKVHS